MRAIEYFVKVAETGSFTKAAAQLAVGQPTVSKGVSALESELGTALLARSPRGLSLTEAGAAFYGRATAVLEGYAELMATGGTERAPGGVVKLSCPLALAAFHVIPRLSPFQAAYPDVHIDLRLSDAFVDLIGEGIDVAVRVGALTDDRLMARKIGEIPRVLCGSADYFAANPPPQTLADLANHRCIRYRGSPAPDVWQFRAEGKSVQMRIAGALTVDSLIGLRTAVLNGLGLGLAGRLLFEAQLQTGLVRAVLPDMQPSALPVNIVFPPRKYMPRAQRLLIDYLAESLGRQPWLNPGGAPSSRSG